MGACHNSEGRWFHRDSVTMEKAISLVIARWTFQGSSTAMRASSWPQWWCQMMWEKIFLKIACSRELESFSSILGAGIATHVREMLACAWKGAPGSNLAATFCTSCSCCTSYKTSPTESVLQSSSLEFPYAWVKGVRLSLAGHICSWRTSQK